MGTATTSSSWTRRGARRSSSRTSTTSSRRSLGVRTGGRSPSRPESASSITSGSRTSRVGWKNSLRSRTRSVRSAASRVVRNLGPRTGVNSRSSRTSTSTQPPRLLLRRGGRTTTLVASLQGKLPTSELVDGELIRYRSFDGRQIPAWLLEPRKGRSRHAAVVDPHGGPESQTVNEWRPRFQFMVAEGFTILAPNYRGGTGYGRAWRRLSDRDLGGGDMQDIIAGGRWLRESRRFPRERLGVVGVSYGGYAVAHVLEQAPELWAVGVSIVGYFNWLTATTNERGYLRRYDRQKMGHPDTDADLYRKFSPIYYLDRIRAPVLFTGGAHDPRCPVTEARGMVEEMKKMGKVVDYLEFPDEGHWPRKMANQITLNERLLAWLKRYLPDA